MYEPEDAARGISLRSVTVWPSIIYKAIGNLRAVQLLLGHAKIDSTVRYLAVYASLRRRPLCGPSKEEAPFRCPDGTRSRQ